MCPVSGGVQTECVRSQGEYRLSVGGLRGSTD